MGSPTFNTFNSISISYKLQKMTVFFTNAVTRSEYIITHRALQTHFPACLGQVKIIDGEGNVHLPCPFEQINIFQLECGLSLYKIEILLFHCNNQNIFYCSAQTKSVIHKNACKRNIGKIFRQANVFYLGKWL